MSTATIKFGPGYDAPWLVIEGENPETIRRDLASAAGIKDIDGITLLQLIPQVAEMAQSGLSVAHQLGATPVASEGPESQPEASEGHSVGDASDPKADLLTDVAKATSTKELGDLWKNNQAIFNANEDVQKAFEKRAAELG